MLSYLLSFLWMIDGMFFYNWLYGRVTLPQQKRHPVLDYESIAGAKSKRVLRAKVLRPDHNVAPVPCFRYFWFRQEHSEVPKRFRCF